MKSIKEGPATAAAAGAGYGARLSGPQSDRITTMKSAFAVSTTVKGVPTQEVAKTGSQLDRENREKWPKKSLSGKTQGIWNLKFCKNTGNLVSEIGTGKVFVMGNIVNLNM